MRERQRLKRCRRAPRSTIPSFPSVSCAYPNTLENEWEGQNSWTCRVRPRFVNFARVRSSLQLERANIWHDSRRAEENRGSSERDGRVPPERFGQISCTMAEGISAQNATACKLGSPARCSCASDRAGERVSIAARTRQVAPDRSSGRGCLPAILLRRRHGADRVASCHDLLHIDQRADAARVARWWVVLGSNQWPLLC